MRLNLKQVTIMKHIFSVAAAFCLLLFISCKNEADKQQTVASPTRTLLSTPINTSPSTTTTNPITTSTPASSNKDTINVPARNANVALNPKHGEPGHRCDIQVGAPLNSPVVSNTQSNTPTITTAPSNVQKVVPNVPSNVQNVLPNSNTGNLKLNPKHGEPGHRCDIAVGAPLNSPVKQ